LAQSKLRRSFPLLILVAAVGIGLLVNLSQWNAVDIVRVTPKVLIWQHSALYTKFIFRNMTNELIRLHQPSPDESHIVSILHGSMNEGSAELFDQFAADTSEGKAAKVIICEYSANEDCIYTNVLFDGNQFLLVSDILQSELNGATKEEAPLRYSYLVTITHPETGSMFVVLTNDKGLTFEQLRDAQIGSGMESIDSYQLFSFSE